MRKRSIESVRAATLILAAVAGCAQSGTTTNAATQQSVPGAMLDLRTIAPHVLVDLNAGDTSKQVYITGAVRLQRGRMAVADGVSDRLTYYRPDGSVDTTIQLGLESPFRARARQLMRVNGDTVALVTGASRAMLFDAEARLLSQFNGEGIVGRVPDGLRILLGFAAGRTFIGSFMQRNAPETGQSRWVDSMAIAILGPDMRPMRILGPYPAVIGAVKDNQRQQVWFAPHGVFALSDSIFFYGYGDRYRIEKFSMNGDPAGEIKRPWQPVAATDADILAYIDGWGSRWITSTGAAAEAEKRQMRSDPFFEYVPAFSQFLAKPSGELWVRTPNLVDAQGNGELNTVPLAPSVWSVFDPNGRWRGVVTIPARTFPMELGSDYLLGVEYGMGKSRKLVMYDLPSKWLSQ
jgi:hypothetical protein